MYVVRAMRPNNVERVESQPLAEQLRVEIFVEHVKLEVTFESSESKSGVISDCRLLRMVADKCQKAWRGKHVTYVHESYPLMRSESYRRSRPTGPYQVDMVHAGSVRQS